MQIAEKHLLKTSFSLAEQILSNFLFEGSLLSFRLIFAPCIDDPGAPCRAKKLLSWVTREPFLLTFPCPFLLHHFLLYLPYKKAIGEDAVKNPDKYTRKRGHMLMTFSMIIMMLSIVGMTSLATKGDSDDDDDNDDDNDDDDDKEFTFYPSCEGGNKRGSPEQLLATAIAQLFDDHHDDPRDDDDDEDHHHLSDNNDYASARARVKLFYYHPGDVKIKLMRISTCSFVCHKTATLHTVHGGSKGQGMIGGCVGIGWVRQHSN